ncbi:MAG: hypothetical protein Q9184_006872 [Pyrenodesmia sp. 2 TL-2023]
MSHFYQQQTPNPTPSLTSLRPPPQARLRPSDYNSSTSDLTIRPSTATLRAPVTHRKHSASTLQAGPGPSTSHKAPTSTLQSLDPSISRKPSTSTLHSGPPPSSTTNPPPSNKITKRASTSSIRTLMHTRSTTSLRPRRQRKPSPAPSISAPAPPTKLLRLSELLDPEDLLREEQQARALTPMGGDIGEGRVIMGEGRRLMVQSPSGQQLDAEAYARRPDRPLTVQERQVRIREETLRKENERRRAELRRVTAKKERGCCGVM